MEPNAEHVAAGAPSSSEGITALGASSSVIGEILSAAQNNIERIAEEADAQSEQVMAGTDDQATELAAARAQVISSLRAELMERASALAMRFEELLDLLDRAERRLCSGAYLGGEKPTGDNALVRLRERQRITFSSEDPEAPTRVVHARAEPPAAEPRRIRWWQRWFREAA
jgi:hypothetical protein